LVRKKIGGEENGREKVGGKKIGDKNAKKFRV
jgi:hypothetical protein